MYSSMGRTLLLIVHTAALWSRLSHQTVVFLLLFFASPWCDVFVGALCIGLRLAINILQVWLSIRINTRMGRHSVGKQALLRWTALFYFLLSDEVQVVSPPPARPTPTPSSRPSHWHRMSPCCFVLTDGRFFYPALACWVSTRSDGVFSSREASLGVSAEITRSVFEGGPSLATYTARVIDTVFA